MTSTILLDPNDRYVDNNGKLPTRPFFDKELLHALSYNTCVSKSGYKMLPPSIRKNVYINNNNITCAITINEIANLSNVLIVVRSNKNLLNGKKFRLNNFKNLIIKKNIEIWIRKFEK